MQPLFEFQHKSFLFFNKTGLFLNLSSISINSQNQNALKSVMAHFNGIFVAYVNSHTICLLKIARYVDKYS